MTLKGIFGSYVGTIIGLEAIKETGKVNFPFKDTTQTFLSLGVLGNAAKGTKEFFKWK